MREFALTRHLQAILGEEGFVHFCQELGGTRVYVPYSLRDENEIVQAVGRDAAEKLSRELAPATIRVPLARRDRAVYFRRQGLSNPQIARKLGITETGVEKLFGREPHLPDRPGRCRNEAQLKLL
ncbi:MAG: hypothetical protein AB7L36_00655 [Sphingomonadaceae bacterium]